MIHIGLTRKDTTACGGSPAPQLQTNGHLNAVGQDCADVKRRGRQQGHGAPHAHRSNGSATVPCLQRTEVNDEMRTMAVTL